jgi:hypothetical protein
MTAFLWIFVRVLGAGLYLVVITCLVAVPPFIKPRWWFMPLAFLMFALAMSFEIFGLTHLHWLDP